MAGRLGCSVEGCEKPHLARGLCSACYQRARYRKDPERFRAQKLARYHRNRDTAREYMRDFGLRHKYGITAEEYDALLVGQDGRCGICDSVPAKNRRLAVDHDHETGTVRGLLCAECNLGLGKFGDSLEKLRAAVAWLDR